MPSDLLEWSESGPARCDPPGPWTDLDWRSVVDDAIAARFWAKVEKSDGCWLWTGSARSNPNGGNHPRMWVDGRHVGVHRLSYELNVGAIPAGLNVCHHCDEPRCVRPDHLFLGTQLDNVRDMAAKGRRYAAGTLTHCRNGHPLTPENTYTPPGTRYQVCRTCRYKQMTARKVRLREGREP